MTVPPPIQIGAFIVLRDVHAPGPAEHRALARDVGRGRATRAQEPLGERGVEAPRHGILDHRAVLGEEGAYLPGLRRALRVRADDADVELGVARLEREHPVRVLEQHRDPARAVVRPLAVDDRRALDAEHARDLVDERVVDGPRAHERRRREGETVVGAPDRDQAGVALLHDPVVALRHPSGGEPGVARPERRVAGEGQLRHGCEDAQAVVGGRVVRREHERRLGEVHPVREALHLLRVEIRGVEHDRDRVAAVGHGREHIDLPEWSLHAATVAPAGPGHW